MKKPFLHHLDELRGRLFKAVVIFLVTAICIYPLVPAIIDWIVRPVGQIHFTAPAEAFVAHIKLALWLAFFVTLPFWLYQIWAFVGSGLKKEERKTIVLFGPVSLFFFMAGAMFAYFLIIPIALDFLLGFARESIKPLITISEYVSFLGTLLLCFGLAFELPLIIAFLAKIGLTSPMFLRSKRRFAIVIIVVLSAVLTPPDMITQVLMAVPLIFLYELGIIFAGMMYKK